MIFVKNIKTYFLKYKYGIFTFIFSLIFFCFSLFWVYSDKAPPTWDDTMYLNHVLSHVTAFKTGGILSLIHSIFKTAPGSMPLVTVLAIPLSLLLGPSEIAGVLTVNFFWFLLAFSIYQISRLLFSKRVGVISFVLLGLLPITQFCTHYFLTDFVLLSLVCFNMYLIIKKFKKETVPFYLMGLSYGFGVLVKVPFIVFTGLPFLVLFVYEFIKNRLKRLQIIRWYMSTFVVACLVSGPYIFVNLSPLLELTKWLSSKQLADLYKMNNPFLFKSFINYYRSQFDKLLPFTIFFGSIISLIVTLLNLKKIKKEKLTSYVLLFSWFFVPFVVFGFSYIQDERYILSALPVLAIVVGNILNQFFLKGLRLIPCFYILFCFCGLYFFSNPILIKKYPNVNNMFINSKIVYPVPDNRYWFTKETITSLTKELKNKNLPLKILMLGNAKEYHPALITYYSRLNGNLIEITTLPYYKKQNVTKEEAIEYAINENKFPILYKTGLNYPEFISNNDDYVITSLNSLSRYYKIDLGVSLPDDNRYYLYK
jgi:hypothetical protein